MLAVFYIPPHPATNPNSHLSRVLVQGKIVIFKNKNKDFFISSTDLKKKKKKKKKTLKIQYASTSTTHRNRMKCNREEQAKSHLMDKSVDFVCGDANNSSFSSYFQDLSGQLPKQVNQM